MASIASQKSDLLASIKSLYLLFGPDGIVNTLRNIPNLKVDMNANPFVFILMLLDAVGVTYDELVEFLAKYVTYAVPALEVSTKAILLAQLKSMVACSIDPRIPEEMRLSNVQNNDNPYMQSAETNGISVSLDCIDILQKLENVHPLGAGGSHYYFGVTGEKAMLSPFDNGGAMNEWQLSRADDFDAFLWFTIHKAKFKKTIKGNTLEQALNAAAPGITLATQNGDVRETILDPFMASFNSYGKVSALKPGTTIMTNSGNVISLCVRDYQNPYFNLQGTVVGGEEYFYCWPVSVNWNSANWYTNSKYYYGYNLGLVKANYKNTYDELHKYGLGISRVQKGKEYHIVSNITKRDYSSERAICNVKYISDRNPMEFITTDTADNILRNYSVDNRTFVFSILPKPLLHVPSFKIEEVEGIIERKTGKTNTDGSPITEFVEYKTFEIAENPFRLKYLLFNEFGEYDTHGAYSVGSYLQKTVDKTTTTYKCNNGCEIYVNNKTGEVTTNGAWKSNFEKILQPCYKGLTVYEFNYDYIMSLKLFDAKNIVSSIFRTISRAKIGLTFDWQRGSKQSVLEEQIHSIIKKILESEDSVYADCYYSFDNAEYDEMLRKAEDKRKMQQKFGDMDSSSINLDETYAILDSYNEGASLHEQQDVLKRSIESASIEFTNNTNTNGTKDSLKMSFLFDFVELLSSAFIEAILSPKVLMAFEVNKQLMGDTTRTPTLEEILENMTGVIVPIIRHIVESIIGELVQLIIQKLVPLIDAMKNYLLQEMIEVYRELIRQIIENCAMFDWSFLKRTKLNTYIDNVDYADITATETEPLIEGNCN